MSRQTVRPEGYYGGVQYASLDTDRAGFPVSGRCQRAHRRRHQAHPGLPLHTARAESHRPDACRHGGVVGLVRRTGCPPAKQLEKGVVGVLEASPRVYDAAFLPSVLTPERRSVAHLREAAARFQADLLLVYRTFCRSFQKYRVFREDRARAFCGVEAVLIDTRTGVVPLSVVASRSFDVEQSAGDLNFRETILKAQLAAVAGALSEAVSDVVHLLETHEDSNRVPG